MAKNQQQELGIFFQPKTGTTLAVTAALSFFVLSMMLPLVGPAGSRVDHAAQNQAAFSTVLTITLILAALSVCSKLGLRKVNGAALPVFSIGLCALCIVTFVVLLAGGFSI